MREAVDNLRAQIRWVIEEYKLLHLCGLLVFLLCIWFLSAVCIWGFERAAAQTAPALRTDDHFLNLTDCLWCTTVYLVSGLEEFEPNTAPAKAAAVVVMVVGVAVLGLVGARLLATFVERARLASFVRRKPGCTFRGHVVICGWSDKGDAIVGQLHARQFAHQRPIIIVAPAAASIRISDRRAYRRVWAVTGDPVSSAALTEANVDAAHGVIVLANPMGNGMHAAVADARSILVSLAIDAVNPRLHACVETLDRSSAQRFRQMGPRELVDVRNVAGKLIAHSAQKHGLSEFFFRLLTVSADTNEVYMTQAPAGLHGSCFRDAQKRLVGGGIPVTLVGLMKHRVPTDAASRVFPGGGELYINPRRGDASASSTNPTAPALTIDSGDRLVLLAHEEPDLDSALAP